VEFWEALATLPASGLPGYAYTAATTQDSLPNGNPYTAFFVQALTTDAFTWFNSASDSGYSVDNLAPPQPQPFAAVYGPSSVALHWTPNPAADLAGYRVYRGTTVDFVPGAMNLIATVQDTGYVDPGRHDESVYKLAAVDVHGNQSRFATVTPNGPTGALISLVSADASGGLVRLRWYAPGNPGIAARLERSAGGAPWIAVASLEADGSGFMAYVDRDVVPGQRYGYHVVVLDGDREAILGETWLAIPPPGMQLRVQNPVVGGTLELDVSLTGAEPARVEAIDIAGRLLASRRLDGQSLGIHHVTVSLPRTAPGMVIVRLTQSGRTLVRRAAQLH